MATPQELLAALEQAGEEYARFIEVQSEAAFHRRPGPDEWTAAELTGHVAEFPVTFSGQARRLVDSPGQPIGRGLDDPGRLAAVAKLAGAGPVQAAAEVRNGVRQAAETLRSIPPDGWRATGQHQRAGELSVADIVERFIVSHLREHLGQARAAVGSGGTG
jgi:DinB superfamily